MGKTVFIAAAVAILAAFFASARPDGLDLIAEKLGFASKAVEQHGLMNGYAVPVLANGTVSTAAAGIAGVMIVAGLFWGAARVMKRSKN